MPRMVCGPKKNKQKSRNVPKNAGTSRKNTLNWKMTSWPIPWELRGSNLVQKKRHQCQKLFAAQKKKKKSRNVPKKRRDVPKKHTQLENDVLANPLAVKGSNFVQKKRINAKNGLRFKKKKKKVGTSRKNARTSRKNTLNWKMTSWPIPWELEAQTLF